MGCNFSSQLAHGFDLFCDCKLVLEVRKETRPFHLNLCFYSIAQRGKVWVIVKIPGHFCTDQLCGDILLDEYCSVSSSPVFQMLHLTKGCVGCLLSRRAVLALTNSGARMSSHDHQGNH